MLVERKPGSSWFSLDRKRLSDNADYLAIALAFSLPLSTSATAFLAVLWLGILVPTLRLQEVCREMMNFESSLPVLLFALAALGMLWADVGWSARAAGLSPFLKLLVIPLLFIQFHRSDRGWCVVYGLMASCVLLMVASLASFLFDRSLIPGKTPGVVVKDYISQSGFFVICIFLLLEFAEKAWLAKKLGLAIAETGLIAAFLVEIGCIATSRTTLLVIPVLLCLFGLRRNWKIAVGACIVWAVLFLLAWQSSPYLQRRLQSTFSLGANDNQLNAVSNRQRIAYWHASIDLIRQSPLIGHGTGSIREMFKNYTSAGADADIGGVANPHNQTLMIALQLGALGTAALYGMWFAHARMLGKPGTAAWFGLVVLTQNFIGSLINSHLSDFTQGWTYAVCVGVAGGMIKRSKSWDVVRPADCAFNRPPNPQ